MTNQIIKVEHEGAILNVRGRFMNVIGAPGAPVVRNQKFLTETRTIKDYDQPAVIQAELRFDDECKNGHNTFSITATIRNPNTRRNRGWINGGCCHDEIAKAFPELAPLIKWHLTSSDAPMHYVANTLYLAGNRDHRGLRKGESKPLINGRTKRPCWDLVAINALGVAISTTPTGLEYQGAEHVPLYILTKNWDGETPPATPKLEWRVQLIHGEGKERQLDAARSNAVWPDATDAELCQDPEALKAALIARHPALMAEFRATMIEAGFIWTE